MNVAIRSVQGRFDSYQLADEALEVPGSASIYQVLERPEILYKEFGRPLAGKDEAMRIDRLVEVGSAVAAAEKGGSRSRVAWPLDAVIEEGHVAGVITPYAGDEYYRRIGGDTLLPRNLNYLRRPDEAIDTGVRLRLLRQLSAVLALLEFASLVHGDISAQNVLWRADPQPSIFLIDCDGMHTDAVEGSPATTEGWTDPRKDAGEIASHDMRSDWFALALAIWRVTTLSKGIPTRTEGELQLPESFHPDLAVLIRRSFADVLDADERPSPMEWVEALDSALGEREISRTLEVEEESSVDLPGFASPGVRRRRLLSPRRLASVTLLAVLMVVASGWLQADPDLGQIHAQAATARWARQRLPAGGLQASCPSDSSLHRGARYLCRVETAGGAVAHVRVDVGTDGAVRRRMNIVAYRARAFAADLRRLYRRRHEQGLPYALDGVHCPHTVSARAGTEFRCKAEFTDQTVGELGLVVHDRSGAYSWREVGASPHGQGVVLR